MRRVFSTTVLFVSLLLLFIPGRAAAQGSGVFVGNAAPDFTLENLEGKPMSLAKALEKGPVLLDFWALWCKPCLQALPGTDELARRFADRGLTVFAINTDSPRSIAKVRSYVKSMGFSFDVLLDPNSDMLRLYRFNRIPQLFLIAPDGKIAFSKLGYAPGQEKLLAHEIEKLLPAEPKAEGCEATGEAGARAAGEEE
ncbi:MAG: TlpA family protein disulfide reductase [Candidatus Eisenbacteria bacterium]|nr:TlpA family protein disulfide reductase [Candidatus Eisenbacteria bacterium]